MAKMLGSEKLRFPPTTPLHLISASFFKPVQTSNSKNDEEGRYTRFLKRIFLFIEI